MTFDDFRRRAEEIFASIPDEYREGVDGLEAVRKTVPHPSLPDVFTLGECLSESYPSDFGGAGEIRSRVVLYYGSFLALSRLSDDWDWEDELFETITHEVRHHLEHLAVDDTLEEMDFAEDQNFARREGEEFDPFYFRSGERIAPNVFRVDGDVFVEQPVDERAFERDRRVRLTYEGEELELAGPEDLGDVHYVKVDDFDPGGGGELLVVLVRRRSAGEWVRGLLGGGKLKVLETSAQRLRG